VENYEVILQNHAIYYPRISSEPENLELKNHPKVQLINAPIVEISSTFIETTLKKAKIFSPFYPLRFGNTLIIIILQEVLQYLFNSASII
jgi:nicotinate-nucleotide adenylyltransferase